MNLNNFWTAALESNDGTVGPDAVTEQSTMQPKPGIGKGDAVESEEKPKKTFGEDHVLTDNDDVDTVAESQEHTLAMEQLQNVSLRFCRMAEALENIAETTEAQLAAGQATSPETVAMITTALDASGIGEPLKDSVALESFDFDAKVATEGFIEAIKDRAAKVWEAIAKFTKKARDITIQKLKRFADYFRGLPGIYDKLIKEGEALANYGGKPFQNSKYEKDLQGDFYSPSSSKTPISVVENSLSEFNEVLKVVGRLSYDMTSMTQSWKNGEPNEVVARMNQGLNTARSLADMGVSKFKHSSTSVEVNFPEKISVDGRSGLEGTKVSYDEGIRDFAAGIRTATIEEIKKLKESAVRADRAMTTAWDALFEMGDEGTYNFRSNADHDDAKVARNLLSKYTNLMRLFTDLSSGATFGSAHGLYRNHFTASRWIRYSIAEAKAAGRAA